MSAAENELSDDLLQYAPEGVRRPHDDGTIRPILERLNRGTSESQGGKDLAPTTRGRSERQPGRRRRWGLIAASAVSAGASAGIAVAAFAWIGPVAHDAPQLQPVDLKPKHVQTVSFKPDEVAPQTPPAVDHADAPARAAQAAAIKAPSDAPPPPPPSQDSAKPAIGPAQLVALWSGIPADVAVQTPAVSPAAETSDPGETAEALTQAKPSHHEHAHVRHARHHTRRHVARTHHAPAGAAASKTQEAAAQPAGNPLQSAWQTLFGHPAANSTPATDTRATFQ